VKTKLLTTTLLLVSIALHSQIIEPTRYNLDSLYNLTTKNDYKYIRVVENYKNQPNLFLFTDYYRSKIVSMKAISTSKDKLKLEGPRIDYYENGNVKQVSNYADNKLSGKQIDWYENKVKKSEKEIVWNSKIKDYDTKILQFWNKEGQQTITDGNGQFEDSDDKVYEKGELKNGIKHGIWEGKDLKEKSNYTEIYNEGIFVSGISTDANNIKYAYKELMTQPTPAKGMTDFYSFIVKKYKRPETQGLKGKVFTTFLIDTDGSITNIRVLRDIGYGTGIEAIRVIASYGKWIPGKKRGLPVKATYSLPLNIESIGNSPSLGPTYESEMIRTSNRY
jgi:antitoxin component YwqK of YwqJK toxin-antitoxin module